MVCASTRGMRASQRLARIALTAMLSCMLGCGAHGEDVSLQGSGATFPAPIYKRWFLDYYQKNPSVRVNYSPIGSGAGIRQFTSGLVMFGASDAGVSALIQLTPGAIGYVEFGYAKLGLGTITAFIGPSGCGKSTVLRCMNRMNDLKRGFRLEGEVRYRGKEIYGKSIDPVAVRRSIGMVFQKPNPFAMTVYRKIFEHPKEKHTQEYIQGEFS
jgi:hypothetical protein